MFQLKRHQNNPIIKPEKEFPWETEGTFNPGVIKKDGEVYMLYRAVGEKETYTSHLGLAKSNDGITFERASDQPVFGPHEVFDQGATEDPRIMSVDGTIYVTYVAVADRIMENGRGIERAFPLQTSTALLTTEDFISFKNLGVISPSGSDNKDIVIFPKKINGRYAMLHRPNHWSKEWFNGPYEQMIDEHNPCRIEELPDTPCIWIAWSDDLLTWTDHKLLLETTKIEAKNGPGMPPIETEHGWLIIYHRVDPIPGTSTLSYSVRAALLDLNDPTKVISKLSHHILSPELSYETESGTHIVFPTGGFIENDTLYVYYGASDKYVCLATGSVKELLDELLSESSQKPTNQ